MARKKADFRMGIAAPENAEELVLLAYKLEELAQREQIPLRTIAPDYQPVDDMGFPSGGWEFNYTGKV